MSRPIEIRLVAVKGKLVGVRCQDRWNMQALFGDAIVFDCRNAAGLKQCRRILAKLGMGDAFKLTKVRTNAPPIWSCSKQEAKSLGPDLVAMLCPEFDAAEVYGMHV
jgi:hypothetical protein